MLGKLLKYDMKAMGRILLPMYLVLIVLSFIMRFAFGDMEQMFSEGAIFNNYLEILRVVLLVVYIFFIAAVSITTLIIIIQRFYKNLLSDEGYLMNTLPVKTWQNILAKLFSAFIWSFLSFVASVLAIIIICSDELFIDIIYGLNELWTALAAETDVKRLIMIASGYAVCAVLQLFLSILLLYASMAVGQLANVHKKSLSVAAFFGIYTAMSIVSGQISTIVMSKYYFISEITESLMFELLTSALVCGIILNTVIIGVLFFVSNYLIDKKLNLE